MTKRMRMTDRPVGRGLAFAAAALLAGCGSSALERRYDGMLTELEGIAPAALGAVADDGRGLFAESAHLERAALVEAVLARNPDIAAARQAWRAALARFPQARALEDPMVTYSVAPRSVASEDAPFGQRVELEQKLPFPGKRRLAGEVALAESESAQENLGALRLDLALMASNLHDDLYVAARAIEINGHHTELLEEFKKSAEAQYVVGRASQQDPLQAEVELARLEQERIMLEAERGVLVAQLNGLLHRPPGAPLPPPGAELGDLPSAPPSRADLEREALATRPELRASAAQVRGARAAIDAARREYYPDLVVMGSYDSMWDMPEHRWMIGVGLNVPLPLSRRAASVDEARARWGRARSEEQTLRDQVRVDVAQAELRAREAAQLLHVVESRLVPAARDQVDAALAGFKTGRNAFVAVIEAEKNLREVELSRHRARPLVAWFTGAPVGGGGSASAGPKVKAGSLVIEASIAPDPPHQKDNVLRLRVSGANGAPVEGASVRVGYVMPAMGAMPEMRGQADVADQGGGRYDARFDLPMGGSWTLSVEVRSKAGSGAARFAITVGTTGLRSEGGSGTGPGTNSRARAAPQAGPTELEAPPLPARDLPPPALSALQDAFTAYEDVRARLAADRLEGVAQPATRVAEQMRAASSALSGQESEVSDRANQGAAAAGKLAAATSLDRARQQFGEVSRFLVALAASDARLQTGWHLFQCPMVKGFKKWFQKSPTLENPYMGQAMSTCGSKTDWQPTPPPAGPKGGGVSHEGHGHEADDVAFYTCSMHPSVEKKEPGTCPICSMNLSPVTYDETEGGAVLIDETRRQLIGLKTTKVERAPLSVAIRAIGRFTYDETRLKDVTLKVQGWVTRLRVSATGQPVKRGEVLFTVYSPELFAAQEEYILALASQKAAHAGGRSDYLVRAAEKKLRLWDVTPSQLAAIAKRATPIEDLPILAPASGYIIEKDVVEGAAVEPGKRLYRIAALDKVWIEAQVYELDLGQVKVGQKARISLPYQAGEALEGTVAYVYPYLDPTSRTGRVRIEVVNRDLAFKPDMYANVELLVDLGSRLQVPIDSVIYTGPRRLVFVDLGEGRIRPQEVTLGARDAERVEVKSGLTEGQMIVTSANFLVAAESRIRSAAEFWSDEPHTAPTAPAVRDVAPPPGQAGHAGH